MGLIVFMMAGGFLGPAWSADVKIAYVDIQKAVNESNAGKEAKKAIGRELEKFQKQIADKQKELQQLKETFEKQAPMLNPEARGTKEKEYQAKVRDFQRWGEDSQNEINQKRVEMEKTISIGLMKVIQKLGSDDGYLLILEKNENIVLFVSKSIEITDRVIKLFDVQKK